jgi:Transglycosylase-like domain
VPQKRRFSTAAVTLGLGLGLAATAYSAVGDESAPGRSGERGTALSVIERGGERFDRAVTEHRIGELTSRYRDLYADAEKLDSAPARSLVSSERPSVAELEDGVDSLRERIAKAREVTNEGISGSGEYDLVGGVSQATLDSIAACESGGDPTAVNAAGYYGKYQFDLGTWQSVGGTGNPAEAPEAEQDMRASMLYARAGSSPWPVCGG